MSDRHPDRQILEKFLADELPARDSRSLQRHVLVCAACEERLIALLPSAPPSAANPTPLDLIRRVLEEARGEARRLTLTEERAQAPSLWERLQGRGQTGRRDPAWEEPAHRNWGLFELLIDQSQRSLSQEPKRAEELARLALGVAGRLDEEVYGLGAVEAAKAKAWTHLGNSLRVLSDFHGAGKALRIAELRFARSWLDPLDEAFLFECRATLRRAQGHHPEALELLDTAISIYREVNEPHLLGRSLMIKGLTLQYAGDSQAACECFRASLFLLDGAREPRLIVLGQCNLLFALHESGRPAQAEALLPQAKVLVEQAGRRLDRVRLRWIEGRIAAALGRPAEAEEAFLEAREEFAENGIGYDTALVSLDLAALYARLGRSAETRRLASEMLPIFQSRELHREALAALIVVQRAAELNQLSLTLVEEVSAYLRQARVNPGLRFRGGERGETSP
jgi:tetratricopeptide (TPR) repeat protein